MPHRPHFLIIGSFIIISMSGCNQLINPPDSEAKSIAANSETATLTPDGADDSWVRIFGNGYESSGAGVRQTEDGGYLIVGGTSPEQESEAFGGVMLLKTDASGEKLWQKTYGGEGYDAGWAISPAHGGGYILAGTTTSYGAGGRDAYLIKVDEDGSKIWERTFGGSLDESVLMAQQTEDGGYFLVGNCVDPKDFIADPGSAGYGGFEGRSNIYVVKTDAEGNEVWSKTLESEFNILTTAGVEAPQGGYYVLGTKVYFPEEGDDLLLVMLDDEGQEVWSRTWEEGTMGGYEMILDSDGNLIITGLIRVTDDSDTDIFVLKIDPMGDEIWQREFGDEELYDIGRDIIESDKGDYIVLVDRLINFYVSGDTTLLMGISREGQQLWVNELKTDYSVKSGNLLQDREGNILLAGATIDDNGRFSTILVKTNIFGNVSE
ncbi:MAG: PQQ-binding-like beta-propeller repeat protein [Anaerolineales bacterium]|jgi:hypothetical protein